jgi:hypothetical protein
MPKDQDEITDMDLPSSEQADLDVAKPAPEKSANFVDDADSSDAADDAKETASVVRNVVDEREEAPKAPGSSPDGEEEPEEAGAPAPKEPDNVDFSDVPFHKHPRFQQLLRAKKDAEVDAVRYRNVETFLDRSGLAADEAADGLEVLGLAKTDPVSAWERVKPWVEKLAVAAGVIMPSDLQQRVQAGELTREAALELSANRAKVSSYTAKQQFDQQQAERRQQIEYQNSIVNAASNWEAERKLKDPNFDAKVVSLQKEIAYLHATEGRPTTPQGVVDQCNRAYKAVNTAFRASAPAQPQPQRRPAVAPVVGGQAAAPATAAPRSTLDIIRANRRAG